MQIIFLLLSAFSTYGHSAKDWESRVIYQIVTDRFSRNSAEKSDCTDLHNYCGGGFIGLRSNLDYIQGMGFDAISLSPITLNTAGGYHGYWPKDFYQINSFFGTEQEFFELIQDLHSRNMWLMLEIVVNNIGPIGIDLSGVSEINPFNKKEYYHEYCKPSQDPLSAEICWFNDLPDLNHEDKYVAEELQKWVEFIVTKYKIDAIRIDKCPQIPLWFLSNLAKSSGLFFICENYSTDIRSHARYQYFIDSTLNFALFELIQNLFKKEHSFKEVKQFVKTSKDFHKNVNVLGNFVGHHHYPRFLNNHGKINRFKNALAWTITWPGIPFIYYGDEQGYFGGNEPENHETLWKDLGNTNSELYSFVTKIVAFRKKNELWKYDMIERWVEDNFYAFSRGKSLMIFSNTDKNRKEIIKSHPFKEGDLVCNILTENDCSVITSDGLEINFTEGECKLIQLSRESVNKVEL